MERVFFFCFRSCLKGDSEREYYDILEIDNPNVATVEIIKRQYKKLSLSVHPVSRASFLHLLYLHLPAAHKLHTISGQISTTWYRSDRRAQTKISED